jgi:uncharacterized protein YjiK
MQRTFQSLLLLVCALSFPLLAADKSATIEKSTPTLGLSGYVLQSGPIKIRGVSNNASGVTYSPRTDSLFVVINSPENVVELDTRGKVKRKIHLDGFRDTEGIAYVGGDQFAIVEEGRHVLSIVTLDQNTSRVGPAVRSVVVDPQSGGNNGLEGVCYDEADQRFFIVKERHPRKIYCFSMPEPGRNNPAITHPWDIDADSLGLRDLSGIWHDSKTGHLLILSHESRRVVECTVAGEEVDALELPSIPQAEGIAMDKRGTLYICSEPDRLYIYTRKRSSEGTRRSTPSL